MASASAAGNAKRSVLPMKSRPAVGGGVVSVMNTAGTPSVNSAVSEPCRGRNGNSSPIMVAMKMIRKA